ncbi:MAG: PRC-barrel domain-containing protein [Candidatus Dormibacteraeota bacterium]|nr:PRC-barrel domain-containing protein [Candidatus Dormibacteraeota bacterium]
MDLHLGAEVFSSDGVHVGVLRRTLVDDDDFKLRAVVVEETRGFSGRGLAPGSLMLEDDLVVPIDAISDAGRERVELRLTSEAVRRLPSYLHYERRSPTARDELLGFATVLGGNPVVGKLEQTAHKPAGEIEIDRGENVMLGHGGHKLGEVQEVLFEGTQLIGVVVKPDGFFQKPVVLPRRFLSRSDDLALFADLTEEETRKLDRFKPTD